DALHATRAAIEEGIVPGGGLALLRAGAGIKKMELEGDEAVGAQILAKAIEAPLMQIAENAGENGTVIVRDLLKEKANVGYNALTNKTEDLIKAGIVDPAKVVRTALQNAASIAGLLLTTESVVVELPQKEEPSAPTPPPY
ncbi:MAG: TCP-1/cpn60 chaperonin family protein, partial [Candidatus Hinthialibacter sp.]